MAALCGDPAGPDAISLKIDENGRYQTEQIRRLERRLKLQVVITVLLSALTIILIAIVAWLGVSVRIAQDDIKILQANDDIPASTGAPTDLSGVLASLARLNASVLGSDPRSLTSQIRQINGTIMPAPVFLARGKPAVPGYTAFGSLSRGSGSWAVYPDRTPWGALSDHLVLTNETNLLLSGTNAVIILGGMDDRSIYSRQMWSYNGVYETYARMPDMPVPRTRFAGAIGNGKIFVSGGYAGPSALNDYDSSVMFAPQDSTLDVFDFATNAWSRNVSATAPLARSDHCAVFVSGRLYLIGGYDTSYNILNTTEVYDPATRRFTRGVVPDLPAPRGDVGCNAVGTVIFVHGGYFDPSGAFLGGMHRNTTWALDTANVAAGWVRKADMNVARGDHAAAVLSGGRLLVMGGENSPDNTNDKTPVRSVEMYNIADDTWSEKAPLQYARFRFGAGVVSSATNGDSAVFAFGGHQLCLNTSAVFAAPSLAALQAMESCASNAADTLSVYSNLVHPDVYVYLKNN